MSDTTTTPKKKTPDYIAFAVRSRAGESPKYTRIGVGFTYRNGSIGVVYDAIPLSGQIVLLDMEASKPSTISYSHPNHKHDFEVSMVKEGSGDKSFWTDVGIAYRQDGYLSILLDVVPTGGKIVLSTPREKA